MITDTDNSNIINRFKSTKRKWSSYTSYKANKTRLKQKLQTIQPGGVTTSSSHACSSSQLQTLIERRTASNTCEELVIPASKIVLSVLWFVKNRDKWSNGRRTDFRSTWHVFRGNLPSRVATAGRRTPATREAFGRRGHFSHFRSSRVARALMLSCRDTRRGVFPDFTLLVPGLCRTLRSSTFNFGFPRSWPF
jgi:hypothetical protein